MLYKFQAFIKINQYGAFNLLRCLVGHLQIIFYDGKENSLRNARHNVHIQVETPYVHICYNEKSGANHTEDIWELIRNIAPNKMVLVFTPSKKVFTPS